MWLPQIWLDQIQEDAMKWTVKKEVVSGKESVVTEIGQYYDVYDALTVARIEAKQLKDVERVDKDTYYLSRESWEHYTYVYVVSEWGTKQKLWEL